MYRLQNGWHFVCATLGTKKSIVQLIRSAVQLSWWLGIIYDRTSPRPFLSALPYHMMTSPNGNIFRVTGHLYGEFTGPRWIPTQRPVTRSFDVFFDLRLNKRLSKQWWGWWFETLPCPLWRHRNGKVYSAPWLFMELRNYSWSSRIRIMELQNYELWKDWLCSSFIEWWSSTIHLWSSIK